MEKKGLDLDVGSAPGDMTPTNPQEAKKQSIQQYIQSLLHACHCRDAKCRLPSCHKMKPVAMHTKICKRKTKGGCPICKQLMTVCCTHAKYCQETKCSVPFCGNIKNKLKQHEGQQEQANPQEAKKQSIQQCIQSLVHACQCRDAKCRLPSCHKMKRVVMHTKICKRRTKGGCSICKQLMAVCCTHAKYCQETMCSVSFCGNIKNKLKQHEGQQEQANPQEAKKQSIQQCIHSLLHACQCRDAKCRLPSCHKMKRVVMHTKICKRRTKGGCPICKQLMAVCCTHAKYCQETKCSLPFCGNIKNKLKQHEEQQRAQQQQS